MGDVEVGVQPQLAEPPADTGDAGEHLLAHHPQHLQERLVLKPAAVLRLLGVAIPALGAEHHAREQIRASRVERVGRRPAQLEEAPDALARVRRDLGRLDRRRERRDHVQLAPPRQRDHAGEIDLAQLDRRTRERAHDRGGVVRVGEQAHPGQHVAHLGPLAERGRPAFLGQGVARRRARSSRQAAQTKDTSLPGARASEPLRSEDGLGRDRLGRRTADRGADRRLGRRGIDTECDADSIEPLAHDFAARVSAYTGLELPAELPPLEVVDRPAWIAANLKTMRPLLDPLTARIGAATTAAGSPASSPARCARPRACCSAHRWGR